MNSGMSYFQEAMMIWLLVLHSCSTTQGQSSGDSGSAPDPTLSNGSLPVLNSDPDSDSGSGQTRWDTATLATGMSILGIAMVIAVIIGIGFVAYRRTRLRQELKAKRVNVQGSGIATSTPEPDLATEDISLQENVSYSSVRRQKYGPMIGDFDSDDYDDVIPTPCSHTYAEPHVPMPRPLP